MTYLRDIGDQTADWDAMWAQEVNDAAQDAYDDNRPTRGECDRDENGPDYYDRAWWRAEQERGWSQ